MWPVARSTATTSRLAREPSPTDCRARPTDCRARPTDDRAGRLTAGPAIVGRPGHQGPRLPSAVAFGPALARHAQPRLRYGLQPLGRDLRVAAVADAVPAGVHAGQRRVDVLQGLHRRGGQDLGHLRTGAVGARVQRVEVPAGGLGARVAGLGVELGQLVEAEPALLLEHGAQAGVVDFVSGRNGAWHSTSPPLLVLGQIRRRRVRKVRATRSAPAGHSPMVGVLAESFLWTYP